MDKRFIICVVVILSFAFLALLANQYLEIYPDKKQIPPSYEVISNNFYAIEQWLNETGHPVRYESGYSLVQIAAAQEKAVLIFDLIYDWEEAEEHLIPWIEKGNFLVIFLNSYYFNENDEYLIEFINSFGIEVEKTNLFQDTGKYADDIPYFDMSINIFIDDNPDILFIKDDQGFIKLVQVPLGEGKLTVTGHPYFMYNYYLEKEVNANLAWELTGAQAAGEDTGVLFLRTLRSNNRRESSSIFGKIMERGNLVPVGISALLVIIFGFWSVIPVFGPVFHEKQKNARPIKERFSAEIRFLKRYKALNYYTETYERELKPDSASEKEENYKYGELINKIRSVYDGTDKLKRRISRPKT